MKFEPKLQNSNEFFQCLLQISLLDENISYISKFYILAEAPDQRVPNNAKKSKKKIEILPKN